MTSMRDQLGVTFCPVCRQDTLPLRSGQCGWCDTQLIPSDRPPLVKKCHQGHRVEGDNLYRDAEGRDRCLTCQRARKREQMRRLRAKARA